MTRRAQLWRVVAAVFTIINGVGAGMAAAEGERLHAGGHIALTLIGAFAFWWIDIRARRLESPGLPIGDERLAQLQQSVDAIAIEVERIGEAQRFSAKLQSEKIEKKP
ncbi:MAG TPA: hypothetical protein VF929_03245 [Gemmatimonadaceae bacterium]